MFLRNYWYACAEAHELAHGMLARRILDEPVLLYRTRDGRPVALADMCCHRQLPLSMGRRVEDNVECGYHGFTYDPDGRCVRIPGQDHIPETARVRTYPVRQRWGWIWIWMGAPEAADEADIPDAHWMEAEGWTAVCDRIGLDCRYELIRDNLVDLSHITFAHAATIGTSKVAETPVTTEVRGDGVRVVREMRDIAPPPFFVRLAGFATNIDRWQIIDWTPPANIVIEAKALPHGSNDWSEGVETQVINFITPETPHSCTYFWAHARNRAVENTGLSRMVHADVVRTFCEDKAIVEAQERRIQAHPDYETTDARFDSGDLQVRRISRRLLEAEAAGRA